MAHNTVHTFITDQLSAVQKRREGETSFTSLVRTQLVSGNRSELLTHTTNSLNYKPPPFARCSRQPTTHPPLNVLSPFGSRATTAATTTNHSFSLRIYRKNIDSIVVSSTCRPIPCRPSSSLSSLSWSTLRKLWRI